MANFISLILYMLLWIASLAVLAPIISLIFFPFLVSLFIMIIITLLLLLFGGSAGRAIVSILLPVVEEKDLLYPVTMFIWGSTVMTLTISIAVKNIEIYEMLAEKNMAFGLGLILVENAFCYICIGMLFDTHKISKDSD